MNRNVGQHIKMLKFQIFFSAIIIITSIFAIIGSLANQMVVYGGPADEKHHVQYWGCGGLYELECTRIVNDFGTFKVEGIARNISTSGGDSAEYSTGSTDNGLLLSPYAESAAHVEILDSSKIDLSEFSISFWMQPLPTQRFGGHVVSHVNGDSTAGWYFDTDINETGSNRIEMVRFTVTNSMGGRFSPSAVAISSKSSFIVGTYDGNLVKLFMNGKLIGETRHEGSYVPVPKRPLTIGADSPSGYYFPWSGIIRDLSIYNESLSIDQIEQLYMEGTVQSVSPISRWLFNGSLTDILQPNNDAVLNTPIASMTFVPDGRLFFTEKNTGQIRIMKNDELLDDSFAKLPVAVASEQGLLGITADPNFPDNHFIYVYYTYLNNDTGLTYNRVSRLTDVNDVGVSEKILVDKIPADIDGQFAGGAMSFGLDGKLYVTVGDAGSVTAPQNSTTLLGKVLRINSDGTIPQDNPFPGSPVYSLGHRNMFGIAFDDLGNGIVTENGEAQFDEINLLSRGANYGYPLVQGPGYYSEPKNNTYVSPIVSYKTTIAPTQAIFYKGDKFPLLKNKFVYGGYDGAELYALELNSSSGRIVKEILILTGVEGPINALASNSKGDLYFGGNKIYKLESMLARQEMQIIFPVESKFSAGIQVSNMIYHEMNNSLSVYIQVSKGAEDVPSFLQLKIPRGLMKGVSDVSITSPNTSLDEKYLRSLATVSERGLSGSSLVNLKGLTPSIYSINITGLITDSG